LLDQAQANTGRAPRQALADAGYCSGDNLAAVADRQAEHGTEVLLATGRLRHGEVPPAPRGRIPKNATLKQRMARKLRTKPGRAAYARRKAIVEPVFGQISTCQDGKRLLLRGLDGARGRVATHLCRAPCRLRPGPRRVLKFHLRARSLRCQASSVAQRRNQVS
jgi:hypothetical protein